MNRRDLLKGAAVGLVTPLASLEAFASIPSQPRWDIVSKALKTIEDRFKTITGTAAEIRERIKGETYTTFNGPVRCRRFFRDFKFIITDNEDLDLYKIDNFVLDNCRVEFSNKRTPYTVDAKGHGSFWQTIKYDGGSSIINLLYKHNQK